MSRVSGFRSALKALWFRLTSLGIVTLVFTEALYLAAGKAQGWTDYLTASEVAFEVAVRLFAAALAGVAMGTLCTAVIVPFLWYFKSAQDRWVDGATKVAVVLVVFLASRFALTTLIQWSYHFSEHRGIYDRVLFAAFYLAFVLALCIPRARKEVVTSFDPLLGETTTRRTALAIVVGTAALVVTEYALAKAVPTVKPALVPRRPKSNFLLISFDALAAEDMSLYGHGLPTTPNIDAFARRASVFKNFISASTFTTPCVATMLTGTYPSEHQVYDLRGRLRAEDAQRSLPNLLRTGGYTTGAFVSNPFAYYFAKDIANGFDVLPEPVFQQGGLQRIWDATVPLHQYTEFGSRIDEYEDLQFVWNSLGRMPVRLSYRMRPDVSFDKARQVLAKLPDGFFLWIHVMTPHDPYLPDAVDRDRFIPDAELLTFDDDNWGQIKPHYQPNQQYMVDRRRLAYDEFVATADRAFGSFMSDLEKGGKLRDTTVIVSADHGESFEGGVYQHHSPYLTRPVIHVPLIIRTPGQQESREIAFTADQTSLAPTILELAGEPKPKWMRGQSLAPWLNHSGRVDGDGLAFTQYLAKKSIYNPLGHGMVGVTDGQYEYVIDVFTQRGALRPLSEAQTWNLDRTAENPAQAARLRAALRLKFPELVRNPL